MMAEPSMTTQVRRPVANAPVSILIRLGAQIEHAYWRVAVDDKSFVGEEHSLAGFGCASYQRGGAGLDLKQ
jgi:hypothetical protein